MSTPDQNNAAAYRSVKRARRARSILIASAIAAFVSVSDGASAAGAAAPISTPSTRASAVAQLASSLVPITVTVGGGSRTGSGLIVRADGYILTSAVLVSGLDHAARIHVTVPDGRRASARVVGIDDSGGLAVLHVSGLGDLVPATFADVGGVTVEQSGTTVRSGMALLDLRAKVVGVYATSSAGSVIPADQAVRAVVEIIASTR